jgi:hypothetical protein
MKLFRLISIAVAGCVVVFAGTALASQQITRPARPGPATTPLGAAENWVEAINQGDQSGACEMQAIGKVGALSCAELPDGRTPRCPKGSRIVARNSKEIRSLAEQVGAVNEESSERAYVGLRAQKKKSKARGAIGLEKQGDIWKVTYLRQGAETFVPAGASYNTEAWRKLWYPAVCSPS